MGQCAARNRRGEPCGRKAAEGKNVCYMHGGAPGSGGQPGNRNAWKHGFYANGLSPDEERDLALAKELEGLDEEIALMRVKIKRVVREAPGNMAILAKGMEALSRLMVTRKRVVGERDVLDEALGKALTELSEELGIPL